MNIYPLFKKTNQKFKKIIQKNEEFIFWLLFFLSIDYLILFLLETTLPGYVMENFNLNILLVFILMGWLFFSNYCQLKDVYFEKIKKIAKIILTGILAFGAWLVLYNIVFWEFLIILILLFLIGFYFLRK